ncbi:MAG: methionine synthase [Dehalococcoidia bacterium]|nr:methionine synthase [Dehalococcoidia bacterium]
MSKQLNYYCAATMIGSVPFTDPGKAWEKTGNYLKDLPVWPQLPMRSNLENMYIQYSEGFPGITIDDQNITIQRDAAFDHALEQLFSDAYANKFENYAIDGQYAAGLHHLARISPLKIIKGQITGPISWGLCVTDESGRGVIYDETIADAIAGFLKLKARWQEEFLRSKSEQAIIFVDEPYLTSLGTAFVALSNEQVTALITETLSGIQGPRGIHCCGGTDWSLLLKLPIDILSFDAYNYVDSLLCYETDLTSFIKAGKAIAWGIIPNDEETLKKESLTSLMDRFGEALAPLTRCGTSIRQLVAQSIITPSCGLASLSDGAVDEVLNLLTQLSDAMRQKYGP